MHCRPFCSFMTATAEFLVLFLQTLYDEAFISLYNVCYTSLPVLVLGIFDQVHSVFSFLFASARFVIYFVSCYNFIIYFMLFLTLCFRRISGLHFILFVIIFAIILFWSVNSKSAALLTCV